MTKNLSINSPKGMHRKDPVVIFGRFFITFAVGFMVGRTYQKQVDYIERRRLLD